MQKLLLIDCYGIFYKSFYAFANNPLKNKKGEETSVIHGFFSTLHKLITEREFDYIAAVLDPGGKTFRHTHYTEYKANRPPTPPSLKEQINFLIPLLRKTGIPVVVAENFEADDVIGVLAKQAEASNVLVEIFSADKDLMQLVSDKVSMIQADRKTGDFVEVHSNEVLEKWGVPPDKIVDLLALLGDSSDNIPGVKGIGQKTAAKLITDFGDLDGIYQNLKQITGKAALTNLEVGKESAYHSRFLVSLATEIPGLPSVTELIPTEIDPTELIADLQTKEVLQVVKKFQISSSNEKWSITSFKTGKLGLPPSAKKRDKSEQKQEHHPLLVSDSEESVQESAQITPYNRTVLEIENISVLVEKIRKEKRFTFDFETTSLVPQDAHIVAAVFVFDDSSSYYLTTFSTTESKTDKRFLSALLPIFEDDQIKKTGHNLKYEYTILKAHNIELRGIEADTMIGAYLLDPDNNHFNLESLIFQVFGIVKKTYKEMADKASSIFEIDKEILQNYTFDDGEYTHRLSIYQRPLLSDSLSILKDMDLPLIPVLGKMEMAGVMIDSDFLKKYSQEMELLQTRYRKNIYSLAGQEFNVNSTKQLQEILFEKLKIKPLKKIKTGYSTDISVLEKLAPKYAIAGALVEYRNVTKLKSTYVDALPELVHPKTHRIHTNYNQTIAATGRLSSTNPNLQNIPIKVEEGRRVREAFISPPGKKILTIDYSQVELRILGKLSGDPQLLKAYTNNIDIHKHTATLLFHKDADEVTSDERRVAKTINFSVMYGISAWSLAEDLKTSVDEAKVFIDGYFNAYKGVKQYISAILEKARETGYVETYFGRKRYLPEILSSNALKKAHAERVAFNSIIQGTAADIIKKAMIAIDNAISKGLDAEMVMQVHDELVFYVPNDSKPIENEIISLMKNITPFDDILDVGCETGAHWNCKG